MIPKLFSVVFLCFFCSLIAVGQSDKKPKDSSTNCDTTEALLSIANSGAGKKGLIFIISRLGNNESDNLHNLRLTSAKSFLVKAFDRLPETIIIAKGEKINGLAVIEIYVCNDPLPIVIKIKRNGELLVECLQE